MVDMLGLEPSAQRCAGSSPVPGNYIKTKKVTKSVEIINRILIRSDVLLKTILPNRHSEVAQSVEQVAVNHWVVGSSPSLGVYILCFIPLYIIRMPITKSAKKAANRSLVFQKRNNEFKLRMKMAIKKLLKNIAKSQKVGQEELNLVYKYIDKCMKV